MRTMRINAEMEPKRKYDLRREEINALFGLFQKTKLSLKAGRVLYKENSSAEGIYYINTGSVRTVTKDNSGNEVLLHYSYSGSLLGLNSVIKNKKHCYTVVANENSEIFFISKKDFLHLLSSNPMVSNYILINLCKQLEDTENIIAECYTEHEARISETIILLMGSISDNPVKILCRDLSGLTGISYEQVEEIISDFKERKLITVKRNYIVSADIKGLKNFCKNRKK
jgi:CRP-like cAMP-binding protein